MLNLIMNVFAPVAGFVFTAAYNMLNPVALTVTSVIGLGSLLLAFACDGSKGLKAIASALASASLTSALWSQAWMQIHAAIQANYNGYSFNLHGYAVAGLTLLVVALVVGIALFAVGMADMSESGEESETAESISDMTLLEQLQAGLIDCVKIESHSNPDRYTIFRMVNGRVVGRIWERQALTAWGANTFDTTGSTSVFLINRISNFGKWTDGITGKTYWVSPCSEHYR